MTAQSQSQDEWEKEVIRNTGKILSTLGLQITPSVLIGSLLNTLLFLVEQQPDKKAALMEIKNSIDLAFQDLAKRDTLVQKVITEEIQSS